MNDVDLWIRLTREMADLSDRYREASRARDAVLMRLQKKGLTQGEIARQLGVSKGRVSQITSRGRKQA